jgi:hypothetical protein
MRLRPPLPIALAIALGLGWIQQSAASPPAIPSPNPEVAPVPAGPPDAFQLAPGVGPADVRDILTGVAYESSDRVSHQPKTTGPQNSGLFPQPSWPSASVASGPVYTYDVINNQNQNVEPSVISISIGSTTYTSAGFIQRLPTGLTQPQFRYRNAVATTSSLTTPNWTYTTLPIPTGYTQSGDPLMDENAYSDGIAPHRIYLTGIIFQDTSCTQTGCVSPNAIGLWHSDNGGLTWSQPTLVDSVLHGGTLFLDKPAVAVASYGFGWRGTVYVAYNKDTFGQASQLLVAKSSDGGITFGAPVLVTSGNVVGVQILTQPFSDKIYLLWVDFDLNAIRMSTSNGFATSWTAPETAATGNMVAESQNGARLNDNVRGLTLPVARYNWVANDVSVAWHEFESLVPGAHTDIFYTAKTSTGWKAKKRINANTANDQFMPGMDFDSNGKLIVTFYDRSQDPPNLLYLESWQRIDYLGNRLDFGTVSTPFSNPNSFGDRFIGDYQSSWFWTFSDAFGSRFNAVWTKQINNTSLGAIDVTGIQ